jgi:fructose-1,6-bisphosphatase
MLFNIHQANYRIINSIRLAKVVNYKVNKAGLVDIVGAAGEQNIQGEDQKNWMFTLMKYLFKRL